MSVLNGHKFIVIGDSYTVGITGGGRTIDSWLDYFVSWYGSEWEGYFKSAIGGYGFAKTDFQFITLLNALDNTISDKASITDILVAGGYNDHGYVTSISSAINTFKQTARTKYPNAALWIAPIGWTTNQYQNDVTQAIEEYILWGKNYGFGVLEEMKYIMRDTSRMSSDEIHPNENGYKALAENMHRYLVSYLSAPKIEYKGTDQWKIRATELFNEGGGGGGGGGSQEVFYDTTAGWNAQTTLVSRAGVIYVYSDYKVESGKNIPNIKVGDGLAYVVDLPFMNMDVTEVQKTFWNNKVTTVDSVQNETLIFTRS